MDVEIEGTTTEASVQRGGHRRLGAVALGLVIAVGLWWMARPAPSADEPAEPAALAEEPAPGFVATPGDRADEVGYDVLVSTDSAVTRIDLGSGEQVTWPTEPMAISYAGATGMLVSAKSDPEGVLSWLPVDDPGAEPMPLAIEGEVVRAPVPVHGNPDHVWVGVFHAENRYVEAVIDLSSNTLVDASTEYSLSGTLGVHYGWGGFISVRRDFAWQPLLEGWSVDAAGGGLVLASRCEHSPEDCEQVWFDDTGQRLDFPPPSEVEPGYQLVVDRSATYLFSLGERASVVDIATGERVDTVEQYLGDVDDYASWLWTPDAVLSPDGQYLIAAKQDAVSVVDLATGTVLAEVVVPGAPIRSATFVAKALSQPEAEDRRPRNVTIPLLRDVPEVPSAGVVELTADQAAAPALAGINHDLLTFTSQGWERTDLRTGEVEVGPEWRVGIDDVLLVDDEWIVATVDGSVVRISLDNLDAIPEAVMSDRYLDVLDARWDEGRGADEPKAIWLFAWNDTGLVSTLVDLVTGELLVEDAPGRLHGSSVDGRIYRWDDGGYVRVLEGWSDFQRTAEWILAARCPLPDECEMAWFDSDGARQNRPLPEIDPDIIWGVSIDADGDFLLVWALGEPVTLFDVARGEVVPVGQGLLEATVGRAPWPSRTLPVVDGRYLLGGDGSRLSIIDLESGVAYEVARQFQDRTSVLIPRSHGSHG